MEHTQQVTPFFYGAVPHQTVDEAYEFLLRSDLPVFPWPQLPQRVFYERSIVQASWGFPGLALDEPQRRQYVERAEAVSGLPAHTTAFLLHTTLPFTQWSPAEAAGLHALVSGRVAVPECVLLKGQLLGPISLAAQLTDEQQQPLVLDPVLFEGIVLHACLRARLQTEALLTLQKPTILCLDEPFLDVLFSPFMTLDREELFFGLARVLESIPAARGLVVRSGVALHQLTQLPLDALILTHWDAQQYGENEFVVLRDFIQSGKTLGFGIIDLPDSNHRAVDQLCAIMKRFEHVGVHASTLRERVWVAPAQSLGQRSLADAEAIVAATCAAAHALDVFLRESAAHSAAPA